ncbi:MAG: sulfatase-like hydrolase/transferase [Solobacterium sp.]|nr:sulfatase-like hydrolase/transferase [Solobacterium sp.]
MKRPHIIILNPDEMRADAVAHLGNPASCTPVLDRLQETEAVSFSNAFCQNPVCVPSRCSFFTGLYPHTRGHRTMTHLLHPEESSLFSELKDAGYYVWMNGRNDLVAGQYEGLDYRHADEIYYYDESVPVGTKPFRLPGPPKEKKDRYMHYTGVVEGPNRLEASDLEVTKAAINRILNPVDPDKPLCLFLGWFNPHCPYVTSPEYRNRIDASKIPERVRFNETTGKSRIIEKLRELTGGSTWTDEQFEEMRAIYLAQCSFIDDLTGMVIDALKEAGIYDDCAIFFLSDHGDFTGDFDLPEKSQNTFEHCLTRVPFLVKPPKGEQVDPGICNGLTELVDFYATVMDYAGVTPDHTQFGRSVRGMLHDRSAAGKEYVFSEGGRRPDEPHCDEWHNKAGQGPKPTDDYWAKKTAQKDNDAHIKGTMIFDGRYKYVKRMNHRDEFYDLETDPGERHNIIETADPAVLARLKDAMFDWYQETCDDVPYKLDSRATSGSNWANIRGFVPPELEETVHDMLRNKDGKEAAAEVMKFLAEKLADKQ